MERSCRHGWIRLRLRITNGRGGCGYTPRAAVLVHSVQVTWAAQPSPVPPRRPVRARPSASIFCKRTPVFAKRRAFALLSCVSGINVLVLCAAVPSAR